VSFLLWPFTVIHCSANVGAERTKIFGKIHYDVRVEPRNIQEEERLLAQRLFDAENSKSKLRIISRNSASGAATLS